jgi:hypothetical protein
MADWKTTRDVPELASLFPARTLPGTGTPVPSAPEEEATVLFSPRPSEQSTEAMNEPSRPLPKATEEDDGVTIARDSSPGGRLSQPALATPNHPTSVLPSSPPEGARAQGAPRAVRRRSITRVGLGSPLAEGGAASARESGPPEPSSTSPEPDGRISPDPSAAHAAPKQTRAARRVSREGNSTLDDLFGQRFNPADGDEEPELEEPAQNTEPGQRRTGARNESSVLFSLDALIRAEREPEPPRRASSAELLLDDGPAAAGFAAPGIGALTSSLSAPDFTAPVRSEPLFLPYAPGSPEQQASDVPLELSTARAKRRSRFGLYAMLLVGSAVGTALALGVPRALLAPPSDPAPAASTPGVEPSPPEARAQNTPPSPTAAAASAVAVGPAAVTTPEAAPAALPAPSSVSAGEPREPAEASVAPRARDAKNSLASTESEAAKVPPSSSASASAEAPEPTAAPPLEGSSGGDQPAEKVPTPADVPPFDRAAAATALGTAAAQAQSCKTIGGPTGKGQATVTFAPSGRVTSASVSGDVAGSSVGSCVAKLFRSTRVPPFSGEAVTVAKRFAID